AIVQRLERLERQGRRWKATATLAIMTLGLVLLIATGKNGETSVPNELQAHAFVLVARDGTPLARLGLLPHGAWGLGFYDQGKKSRIVLSVEGDGASSISLLGRAAKGVCSFVPTATVRVSWVLWIRIGSPALPLLTCPEVFPFRNLL